MALLVVSCVLSQEEYQLWLFQEELLRNKGNNWANQYVRHFHDFSCKVNDSYSCHLLILCFVKAGYKIQLEGVKGRETRYLFCTTGILLKRLHVDQNLKDVTHVIVDEIHEQEMNEGNLKLFWLYIIMFLAVIASVPFFQSIIPKHLNIYP